MNKQFVKMMGVALVAAAVWSGAEAKAASISFNLNLANGQANVALRDHCHQVVRKKVEVKHDKHHAKKHVVCHKKHHHNRKKEGRRNNKHNHRR